MQTNGTDLTIPPTINDMLNAVEKLWNKCPYPPPKEFKIHPDDYEELKRQAEPYLLHPAPGVPNILMGLNVVIDATAERLPRKQRGQ